MSICRPVVNLVRPAFLTLKRMQPSSSHRLIVWRSTPSSSAASRWLYLLSGSQVGLTCTIAGNGKFQPIAFAGKAAVFYPAQRVGGVFLAVHIVAIFAGNGNFFTVPHRPQTFAGNFFGSICRHFGSFYFHFCHFSLKTSFVCWLARKNCLPLPVDFMRFRPFRSAAFSLPFSFVGSFVGAKVEVFR